jgi:hypothetical protein
MKLEHFTWLKCFLEEMAFWKGGVWWSLWALFYLFHPLDNLFLSDVLFCLPWAIQLEDVNKIDKDTKLVRGASV